jgi:hypothetical protein
MMTAFSIQNRGKGNGNAFRTRVDSSIFRDGLLTPNWIRALAPSFTQVRRFNELECTTDIPKIRNNRFGFTKQLNNGPSNLRFSLTKQTAPTDSRSDG